MKRSILTLLIFGLLAANAQAQTSGKITYEGMREIDFSQMRGNGQGGPPPGANESTEGAGAPQVINFTQKLVFAGSMAKEERDRPQGGMMFRRNRAEGGGAGQGGPGGGDGNRPWRGGNGQRMTPPFEQTTFLDLANRQRIDVMTIKKDSATSQTYRSEKPLPAATNWKEDSKTKKIAGYVCHKATATHHKMPYTIWYTTDLPITYSPVADLTPPKGVVLLIESDTESYKASNVSMEAVAEASVQPPKDAKAVTSEEMDQIRRKGMADMRQRMMQNMPRN